MSFTTYKLSYNPDWIGNQGLYTVKIQTTNMNLGTGWTFIDLDIEENRRSILTQQNLTSIEEFLKYAAPLIVTIPEIMSIFYYVKKFQITTSLAAGSLSDPKTTTNTIINEGSDNDNVNIDSIYKFICGPTGHQFPSDWFGRSAYGYQNEFPFTNVITFRMRPVFYIYQKKYYIELDYIQGYEVDIGDDQTDTGQVSIYTSSFASTVACGNLTILGKTVPLYNLSPIEDHPVTCNVTVNPIEYWTVPS